MTKQKSRSLRPSSRLIEHDIKIGLECVRGAAKVMATVECERKHCMLDVNSCAHCERFARIDVHEAGYTLLCRSTDEELEDDEDA